MSEAVSEKKALKLYRTQSVRIRGNNAEVHAIVVAPNQKSAVTIANTYFLSCRMIVYPINENNFIELRPYENAMFCLSNHA